MKILLLAAVVLASLAAPAGAGPALRYKTVGACRAAMTVEGILKEAAATGALPVQLGEHRPKMVMDLVWYHVCIGAVATGKVSCEPLSALKYETAKPWPDNIAENCEDLSHEMIFWKALLTGNSDALPLCRGAAGQFKSGGASDDECAVLVSHFNEAPAALCARLSALKAKHPNKCLAQVRMLHGEQDCSQFPPVTNDHYICPDIKAFLKAQAGGKTESCGDRGICRAMRGEGQASCAINGKRLVDTYCGALFDSLK